MHTHLTISHLIALIKDSLIYSNISWNMCSTARQTAFVITEMLYFCAATTGMIWRLMKPLSSGKGLYFMRHTETRIPVERTTVSPAWIAVKLKVTRRKRGGDKKFCTIYCYVFPNHPLHPHHSHHVIHRPHTPCPLSSVLYSQLHDDFTSFISFFFLFSLLSFLFSLLSFLPSLLSFLLSLFSFLHSLLSFFFSLLSFLFSLLSFLPSLLSFLFSLLSFFFSLNFNDGQCITLDLTVGPKSGQGTPQTCTTNTTHLRTQSPLKLRKTRRTRRKLLWHPAMEHENENENENENESSTVHAYVSIVTKSRVG